MTDQVMSADPAMSPKKCGAHDNHRNNRGEPCGAYVVKGTRACPRHSGKTLERAKAEGALRTAVLQWGLGDVCADPGEVLLRLVTQSAHRAQALAAELEQLATESPSLRDALIGDAYGEFGKQGEYIRGLARMEAEERDRCASFATKAIAAGLAERQVRLAEQQGALMAAAVKAILDDLGLTPAQQALVGEVVPRHLRAITTGGLT